MCQPTVCSLNPHVTGSCASLIICCRRHWGTTIWRYSSVWSELASLQQSTWSSTTRLSQIEEVVSRLWTQCCQGLCTRSHTAFIWPDTGFTNGSSCYNLLIYWVLYDLVQVRFFSSCDSREVPGSSPSSFLRDFTFSDWLLSWPISTVSPSVSSSTSLSPVPVS